MKSLFRPRWLALLGLTMFTPCLIAGTVLQMNLEQMSQRADRIFRGTLLDTVHDTMKIGGGELPTVTYVLRIDETFKGRFDPIKGEPLIEVRMIGKVAAVQVGNAKRVNVLPDMPKLEIGRSYVLFTTAPGGAGLSTTVGLGQGAFRVIGEKGKELAVNEIGNVGLFRDMPRMQAESTEDGRPLTYAELAAAIRSGLAGE